MRAVLFSGILLILLAGGIQAGPTIQIAINPRPAYCPPRTPTYCPPPLCYVPYYPQAYWGPAGIYYSTGRYSAAPAFTTGIYKVPPPPPLITTPVTVPAGRAFRWK